MFPFSGTPFIACLTINHLNPVSFPFYSNKGCVLISDHGSSSCQSELFWVMQSTSIGRYSLGSSQCCPEIPEEIVMLYKVHSVV